MNDTATPSLLSKLPNRNFWERYYLRDTYRQCVDLEHHHDGLLRAIRDRFISRPAVTFIAERVGADTSGTVADIQEEFADHGRAPW